MWAEANSAGVSVNSDQKPTLTSRRKNPRPETPGFFMLQFLRSLSWIFLTLSRRQGYRADQQHGGRACGLGHEGDEAGVAAGVEHSAIGVEQAAGTGEFFGERAVFAELGGELVPLVIGEDVAGDGGE